PPCLSTLVLSALYLHDALPISDLGNAVRQDVEEEVGATVELEHHGPGETDVGRVREQSGHDIDARDAQQHELDGDPGIVRPHAQDRKSTRLNSSHVSISYAVFC